MAEMKNICGKIPVELHEKVRAEIEEKETSTQIFIQQVIEEHFNRLEGKGEESMEKRTLAVQVTEELFQRVKWVVAKEGIKQKDFIIRIIEKAVEEVEAKWKELKQPEETPEADRLEEAEETTKSGIVLTSAAQEKPQISRVIAVGPGGMVDGKEVVMQLKAGDRVITGKYTGTEVKIDGEEYTIVRQSDVLAVVE